MVTRNEKDILEIISEKGEETSMVAIARGMGMRLDYTRSIVESMGRRDVVDVLMSGKVRLTPRGWKALGKQPFGDRISETASPESPEERYQKWTKSG